MTNSEKPAPIEETQKNAETINFKKRNKEISERLKKLLDEMERLMADIRSQLKKDF